MYWDWFFDLCVKAGTKPSTVGKKIGIDSGTISQWKQGVQPSTEKVQVIAEYFNVSADYLLGNTDNPKAYTSSESETERALINLIKQLTHEQQELVLAQIRGILANQQKK